MKKKFLIIGLPIFVLIISAIFFSDLGWNITTNASIAETSDKSLIIDNLKKHVIELSSKIGIRNMKSYEKLNMAEKYILSEFEKEGYKLTLQNYDVDNKTVYNIIVKKDGTDRSLEPLIIGAHYDTDENPGADDNASGIAGLLELSRMFNDKTISRDLIFVAFVNEEEPYFQKETMGSKEFADSLKNENQKIKGAIILEMIGIYSNKANSQKYPRPLGILYPNKGNFLMSIGNSKSKKLMQEFEKPFEKSCGIPYRDISFDVEGTDWSDHWSFWVNGYKAIMLTDTAYLRNFNYHTNNDTYEKLNYKYMAETVKGIYGALFNMVKWLAFQKV